MGVSAGVAGAELAVGVGAVFGAGDVVVDDDVRREVDLKVGLGDAADLHVGDEGDELGFDLGGGGSGATHGAGGEPDVVALGGLDDVGVLLVVAAAVGGMVEVLAAHRHPSAG